MAARIWIHRLFAGGFPSSNPMCLPFPTPAGSLTGMLRLAAALGLAFALAPTALSAATIPDVSNALFSTESNSGPDLRLEIEISPAALDKLRDYQWNRAEPDLPRENVPAQIREGGILYTNVLLHLKGSAGSFRPVDDKPAFTLQFDKAEAGQRFHGLQKIHLNNSVQDSSYASEIVCRELFLSAGIPTPRATLARVSLNGRLLGLYVLVEGWNKQFLKRHFANTHGNLWDGGFVRDISTPLAVNSGDQPADRSALDRLVEAAGETNLNRRLARLDTVLDLDRFLTFSAMESLLVHWDGYTMNRNNYRVFHDLDSGKLVFLPHGLDQMFGQWRTRPDHPITPPLRGLVGRAILQTPEGRKRYLARMSQLFTNVFRAEAMQGRVEQIAAQAQRMLEGSPNERQRQQRFTAALADRIRLREQSVREQLAEATAPLRFETNGVARLTRWNSKTDFGNPAFDRLHSPFEVLQITAPGSASYGSWRRTVLLEPGHYRLEGRVKTEALVFGPGVARGGVTLRISGDRNAPMQPQLSQWTAVSCDFTTGGLEDVELVCELRASQGWVWFREDSLRLIRLSAGGPTAAPAPAASRAP